MAGDNNFGRDNYHGLQNFKPGLLGSTTIRRHNKQDGHPHANFHMCIECVYVVVQLDRIQDRLLQTVKYSCG